MCVCVLAKGKEGGDWMVFSKLTFVDSDVLASFFGISPLPSLFLCLSF